MWVVARWALAILASVAPLAALNSLLLLSILNNLFPGKWTVPTVNWVFNEYDITFPNTEPWAPGFPPW